jgi:hypothetical protein
MVDEALAALEVLGLSGLPEDGEIRRAYLRKVKEHPPERDADGFRRVREAYDFLKGNPWMLAQRLRAAAPSPAPVVEAPVVEAPVVAAPVVEAPEVSFPPFVRAQIDAVNRGLEDDDPATAAEAMIELYQRPVLEGAPTPPPILALRTYIVLVERGRLKLAKSLLAAFEHHMDVQQTPLGGGGEIGARWKLAREVQATLELDQPLGRAVATGLRSGQLFTAADAVAAAYNRHYRELERHMVKHAPTLWSSLAPLMQVAPRAEAASSSSGFRVGTWPVGLIAVVLLNLVRLCAGHESKPSPTSYYEPPPIRATASPLVTALPTTSSPLVFDNGLPYVPAEVPAEVVERQLTGSWGSIERALKIGDCQGVREQWPLYRAAQSGAHVDEKRERQRRGAVLAMCSELKDLLEEP